MKLDNEEVLSLVSKIHHTKEDLEAGDLAQRILQYSHYELQEVELSLLDAEEWHTDEEMLYEYTTLNTPIPPIVISSSYSIIDGAHRVKVAKRKGLKYILAYVGKK